ncbi:hypothetical protein AB0L59_33895 [Streptomyces sp. NPDC052109]|uniref:hypothetical protein n=1 Tax=Streptomyces sp. NPDC052109 TaxID=3155527 RepID=UPI0034167B12
MLRILDARTGEPVPARRGPTRIEARADGLDPTALRVLLTADLLVRALELGGTPVWTILTAPHDRTALRTAATALTIHPFEDARDLTPGPGTVQAIQVTAGAADASGGGPVVRVAPVEWRGECLAGRRADPTSGHAPESAPDPALPALLQDPSALRLALLTVPRGEAVRLDSALLEEAAGRLARWRRAVAGWARRPSRPVPDEVRARLRSAWEDDLDLPGVLEVLRAVESAPDLADGARFETYVYADRLLALDLARDLGSPT